MSEEIISKEELEERYKKVIIRTEETINPFSGEKEKRTVVDLIHDGIVYYVHIEFSPFGTTYSGDMGCFMFQPGYGVGTFKGKTINPGYWGEKIKAAGQEYFIRDFDMQNVNRAYKEEILQHYEYEWEEKYFEEAKKAWKMSNDDFENGTKHGTKEMTRKSTPTLLKKSNEYAMPENRPITPTGIQKRVHTMLWKLPRDELN